MITKNNIEISDSEYKEKLRETLNFIMNEYIKTEEYELCGFCLKMLNDIDRQKPEVIKDMLTKLKISLKLTQQI